MQIMMRKLTPNRTLQTLAGGVSLVCVSLLSAACDTTADSRGEAASREEQTRTLRPATDQPTARAGEPGTPQTVHATPETAVDERPSVEDNMGRGFQGRLVMRLRAPSGERTLRYQTRGNRARLQVDAPSGGPEKGSFDALIWDQSMSMLDHERKTYHTVALEDVQERSKPDTDVKIEKTGERSSLSGVTCERYEITQGEVHVSTCVSALPGSFNVAKLETSSGMDIPPWAEQLLAAQLLPLQAKATDSGGRELYVLELIDYSPGPVDEALLTLPQNYGAAGTAGPSEGSTQR